ncbi:sodium/potassium-transporting ATPase subunit beta-like [Haliotis cracherodii]|uniref:sodium/potassium-transporting ATPase subunit beta-like n=1 Tax=Haliotis cracherodii TaxID=6455 RepID=UPI0039EC1D95
MASTGYGRVSRGTAHRDDEDGLVDEWGIRYEGHHKPGGGTFTRKKHTRRKYLIAAVAGGIILLIVLVIIAVAVQKKHKESMIRTMCGHPRHTNLQKWQNKSAEGLQVFPAAKDKTALISFCVNKGHNSGGYGDVLNNLESHLYDYHMMNQQGYDHVKCNDSYAPPDKVCVFDLSTLGNCDHFHHYGYSSGTPCVMLQLNLPRNVTAKAFANNTAESKKLGHRYSHDYIGVTCDGATDEDRKNIGKETPFPSPIQYFPRNGFPVSWYRPRITNKFLAPIVMVKFNTLFDGVYVNITCTAWGKSFNNGKPETSDLYTTTFVIYHE